MRRLTALALSLLLPIALATCQAPTVHWSHETMRLRAANVTPGSPPGTWQVTLTMENDNANSSLPTSFRRWWHCQIDNLDPAGSTLVVTVTNAGYSDVILPVWALSTDGGGSFAPYTRCPVSAVPTQPTSTQHRFTLVTPPGVNAIRLAKYFPYGVARKDAFLQGLIGAPRVRSIATLGLSAQGRPIQRVQLTDSAVPDAGKARIWIHSGIHPAETSSYFTVEGLIGWLLSGDPHAELLLDHTILDVVPMANPDGVALGNYRVNANSVNLEEQWSAPYASNQPEIVALRSAIEAAMGTPQAPGSNPIRVLLNLHASHNVAWPFHFQHTANPNWNPTTNNTGVLPVVNAIEGQWIQAFRARSPFVARGATQASNLTTRPFVESMMHDRWSGLPQWTGAPAFQQPVMAITFEGTYGRGPDGVAWNDESDYRLVGAQLGRALVDYLGLSLTAQVSPYGSPCRTALLVGSVAPSGNGHLVQGQLVGAAGSALGFLVLGFQRTATALPVPWQQCSLLSSLDATEALPVNPLGMAQWNLFLPPWPGLLVHATTVTIDASLPSLPLDTSNGLELRNNF